MIGYWLIYLSQGAFLGALGPALQEMSYQGNAVSSYNPAFAWHALGSILSVGFLAEVLVQACLSSILGRTGLHIMLGTMSILLTAWYVCLPWVNQWGGSEWASCFFFVKGVIVAIVNVTINKCAAWTTAGNEATTRRVVNSLNGAFAVGTVLVRVGIPRSFHVLTCFFVQGPILGIIQRQAKLELEYLFIMVGSLTLLAAFFIYLTDCPYPSGEESASLLGFEEDLRSVPPVLPSPISGSVFLHVKHDLGAANLNPDSYDPEANFIVLLVMIIATLFYGIQMGLAAFLFQYLEFVMALGYGANLHSICCSIMCVFWLALALSYSLFTSCLFEHMKSLGWLFFLNVLCVVTMAGVIFGQNLFGPDYVVAALTFHLVLFAVFISPLFTATIQGLTNVVNPDLLARVSSLLVFGCFCGEAFIPVLMGFFMGDYSGSGFGAGTIVYITFALTITMMTTTGWFWYSVVTKQQVVDGVGAAAPSPAKPLK
ncbi:hypothetical protein DYB25_007381 [Aphanomyces astaci]|uniref:Uncharacterized protein n=2 Tax=Aphanomyces astaci TaxID=112090 RepID=A0A396ZVY1_APHAT|nr:hypothetical protein DYB36_011728 [Aphanomyces astaci]RHX97837.1 hypothetical protein DYB25_007381 [Aphanomyces astaci]RHY48831.1 hypothetical protein DYB38_012677 [Aphanomyces astaci]RHY57840.1 hypothetical protein DYB34_002564 [Aphanomyces astaci]RHY66510.1 hypothetical protein DYB30_002819 [Aphanomyces astaci]